VRSIHEMTCGVEGCHRKAKRKSRKFEGVVCFSHGEREDGRIPEDQPIRAWTKNGPKCSVESCTRKARRKGYCQPHYDRTRTPKGLRPEEALRGDRAELHHDALFIRPTALAFQALKRRSEKTSVPMVMLVRALLDQWAMSDGAEQEVELSPAAVRREAWRRTGLLMEGV
jgi:hypothetical protein